MNQKWSEILNLLNISQKNREELLQNTDLIILSKKQVKIEVKNKYLEKLIIRDLELIVEEIKRKLSQEELIVFLNDELIDNLETSNVDVTFLDEQKISNWNDSKKDLIHTIEINKDDINYSKLSLEKNTVFFYNKILSSYRKISFEKKELEYKKNLKYSFLGILLIFPFFYFLFCYFFYKKKTKQKIKEIKLLLSLQFEPLDKHSIRMLDYLMQKNL